MRVQLSRVVPPPVYNVELQLTRAELDILVEVLDPSLVPRVFEPLQERNRAFGVRLAGDLRALATSAEDCR